MILDTSALVAVITVEETAPALFDVLADAPVISVGAPSLVETAMVLEGRLAGSSPAASSRLALFMARFDVEVLPFVAQHWPVAWAAFLRYGKGRHPAGLNFGDCLTYATAKLAGQPLLCLGEDFARTDLELVSLPS
jgi:ribonuclease VapC